MDDIEQTRATYDRVARDFAARTAAYLNETALALFRGRLERGDWVLDAGCGPGRDSAYLAGLDLRPIAYDFSAGMLAEGRRLGLAVPQVQGDLRRLPFADGAFAGAWANASLLHLPRLDFVPALRELARVARRCLFLSLKQGLGEERRTDNGAFRFFTYYEPEEAQAAMVRAGWLLVEHWPGTPSADGRAWMFMIAERST